MSMPFKDVTSSSQSPFGGNDTSSSSPRKVLLRVHPLFPCLRSHWIPLRGGMLGKDSDKSDFMCMCIGRSLWRKSQTFLEGMCPPDMWPRIFFVFIYFHYENTSPILFSVYVGLVCALSPLLLIIFYAMLSSVIKVLFFSSSRVFLSALWLAREDPEYMLDLSRKQPNSVARNPKHLIT